MNEPTVYVWRVREVAGCVGFDEAGMPLGQGGKIVETFEPVPLSVALVSEYKSDAHFVPYMLVGADGVPVAAPRINRAAWEAFHERGYWLRFGCLPLDFDDPVAHASGEPASDEWRATWWSETLPRIEARVGATVYAYDTKGGARAVVVLPEPLPGPTYIDVVAGLVQWGKESGIAIDPLKEMQRCYRLPFVKRGGAMERRTLRIDGVLPADSMMLGQLGRLGRMYPMEKRVKVEWSDTREMVPPRPPGAEERPGDVFSRVRSWGDVLLPHGWTYGGTANGQETWFRPGKEPGGSPSALTNYMGGGKLYVFTTSTELEAGRSYDKFGLYARLHGLDMTEAMRRVRAELAAEGHMRAWEDRPAKPTRREPPEMPDHMREEIPLEAYEQPETPKRTRLDVVRSQRPDKPEIVLRAGDLEGLMAEAADALAGDDDVYTRAGAVVEAALTSEGFRLVPLEKASMRGVMERNATWIRMVKKKDEDGATVLEPTIVNVDDRVVDGFLASPRHWMGLRDVKNVHGLPVVRPDGTMAGEGYDPDTRLLIRYEGVRFGEVGRSRKDAEAAAAALLDIFAEFPFESEDDRAVAVALAVTACVRRVLPLCPGTLVDSPSSGIGKGLVINVASILMTGRPAVAMAQPKDEDELTKTLFSALRDGDHHIAFDNVSGKFGGEAYDMLMTSEVFKARILGQSKSQSVPASALVTISGRNVAFRGDAAGRTLRCRLVTESEQPDKGRTFKYQPLEAHVQANRGALVAACLTIVRAYVLAGRPCEMPPLRMYYDWCRMVREPLVWLGMADPVRTIDKQRVESDVDFAAYGELAHAMYEAFGDRAMTMTRMVKEANAAGPYHDKRERLRDAIQELTGVESTSPKVQSLLGYKMRSNAGRPFDGLKLGRVGKADGAEPVRGRDGVLFQVTVVGDGPTHTKPPEASRVVNIVTGKNESLGGW
jgi:hypothetical protein